jgi:cytochrome c oxidase assembly factor CtaG
MFLGSRAAAEPYVHASKLFTVLYFVYFLIVLPMLAFYSSHLVESKQVPARISVKSKSFSPVRSDLTALIIWGIVFYLLYYPRG